MLCGTVCKGRGGAEGSFSAVSCIGSIPLLLLFRLYAMKHMQQVQMDHTQQKSTKMLRAIPTMDPITVSEEGSNRQEHS